MATETMVSYHDGRPAINVKDHHSGQDFVFAVERLIGGPASGLLGESVGCRYDDTLRDVAYERIASGFWMTAEQIAQQRGLGPIYQDGRSGGWLVFEDDPTNGGDEFPSSEWLADYRALSEWADEFIASAPERVAALAQQLAMDELGRGPAARMFAFESEIPAATWAYEGGAPRMAFS